MPKPTAPQALSALFALVLLFGSGYLAGRGCSEPPAEVRTTDRLEERAKTAIEERSETAERKDEQKDEQKDVEKTKTTTRRPDGTVVIEERTKDLSKTETKTVQVRVEKVEVEKRVDVVKVETRERIVTNRPKWLIGVNAGVSIPALLGRPVPSYLPGVPPAAVIGVSVERHLFWGVYGGVFANSQGVVGGSARKGF